MQKSWWLRLVKKSLLSRSRPQSALRVPPSFRSWPQLETLECRDVPSAVVAHPDYLLKLNSHGKPLGSPSPTGGGFTPAAIEQAYSFPTSTGGSGTTIAIVDAYSDPSISSDLSAFDSYFSLPTASLKVVSQTGSTTSLPAANTGWAGEIALDVEWAHAIAPEANILLVEAKSANMSDLMTAVKYAASVKGVDVVSMSWGGGEFSGESSYDADFIAPSTNPDVVFVNSSGDSGAPASYPSTSPNVLSVGGTSLTATSSGAYSSESAWSDSGGGISKYELKPSYQSSDGETTKYRTSPDVSYDSNPNTGFPVYQTYGNSQTAPWLQYGGTSDASPQWAALIAIADSERLSAGEAALTNATLMPILYSAPSSDFHDITTGSNNQYSAAKGYDLVTGLGTPVAGNLITTLVGSTSPTTVTHFVVTSTSSGSITVGSPFSITVTAENASNAVVPSFSGTINLTTSSGTVTPLTYSSFTGGVATFNITLTAAGSDTVTVSQSGNSAVTGSATFSVSTPTFSISGPTTVTAGVPQNYTITALLPGGAADSGYSGPITLSSNPSTGVIFGTPTFGSNGIASVSVTFDKTGTVSITATDKTYSSFTGTETGISVLPSTPTQLIFSQQPTNTSTGTSISPAITLTEEDVYGNIVTTDSSSTVTLQLVSGTGLGGTLTETVKNGVATFSNITESATGTYQLLAQDVVSPTTTLSATSSSFTISTSPPPPPPGSGNVIENFTNGLSNYYYYDIGTYYPEAYVSPAAAHLGTTGTGGQGLVDPGDGNWYFRMDSGAVVSPGDTITAWVEFPSAASGRAYFGFGTTNSGLDSVVLAPNTNQLIVQSNYGFDSFTSLAATTQRYAANTWYEIQINWGSVSGHVNVQLLSSSGSVLSSLNNVSTGGLTAGWFAFRSTGGAYFSTVTDTPGINNFAVLRSTGTGSSSSNSGYSNSSSTNLSGSDPYLWLPASPVVEGGSAAQELWYVMQQEILLGEEGGFLFF